MLTSDLIEKARMLQAQNLSYMEIARRLKVPKTTIYYALNPERRNIHAARWRTKLKEGGASVKVRKYSKLKGEDVKLIVELYNRGETTTYISRKVGCSPSTVYNVLGKYRSS